MDQLEIRYSTLKDFEYLHKWLKDPDNNRWFPFSTKKEVEDSAKNWIGFSRYGSSLTGVLDGTVCSVATLFLMPYKKLVHHAMFYLIVDKNFRNKGVGTSMLKNIMNLGQNYFKLESVFAEVFEGSAIISLLKKFNFEQTAYQEKYVKDKDQYLARILFDIWFK
ncbi:MAG: GNAT family N-acetyltransferase [Parachlamydiales bacterium]|nr:GNAT family N-acetyltransferase [Parachlamydiales bacterium]